MKTIPFNYDDWKSGKGKAVYRDGTEPRFIHETPPMTGKLELFTITNEVPAQLHWHYRTGDTNTEKSKDLLLQIEPEYVPLEQIDWIIGGPWWIRGFGEFYNMLVPNVAKCGGVYIDNLHARFTTSRDLMGKYERTNAARLSDPSIPADQKWIPCRKEKM